MLIWNTHSQNFILDYTTWLSERFWNAPKIYEKMLATDSNFGDQRTQQAARRKRRTARSWSRVRRGSFFYNLIIFITRTPPIIERSNIKVQVARLGSKIQQSEDFAKSETRQLKETTDKSMKEVTRTLATLVEQHRSKVGEIKQELQTRGRLRVFPGYLWETLDF